MSNLDNKILEAIEIMIEERLKDLKFNRDIQVQVTVVNSGNTYNVTYKGQTITNVKARFGTTFVVSDVCWVHIPNNEFSLMYLDSKVL